MVDKLPGAEWPGLPVGGPATLANVKTQLDIGDNEDDATLTLIVDAVNSQVRTWPVSEYVAGALQWPVSIQLGATMLCCRLFRRKNSPAGVEAFGSQGAVYVQRSDPDIAQLLRIGSWSAPGVG